MSGRNGSDYHPGIKLADQALLPWPGLGVLFFPLFLIDLIGPANASQVHKAGLILLGRRALARRWSLSVGQLTKATRTITLAPGRPQ